MARSRLKSASRGKHINKNIWSHVKYIDNDPEAPYTVGQVLHVYPQDVEQDFIPCIPAPNSLFPMTRVPYKAQVTFLGMVEFLDGAKCMRFVVDNDNNEVFLGLGCLPHLCNIPKRPAIGVYTKSSRSRKKRKVGKGGKKSPARLAKIQAQNRIKAQKDA